MPAPTHGASRGWPKGADPEYRTWLHIRGRCFNPTDAAYRHYGGRGITVCERWAEYANFIADMGPRPSPKHTLDRIDNNGNYEPGNCEWTTMKQQSRNRRSTRFVTFQGQEMSLAEACERAGADYKKVHRRMYRDGWTLDQSLG